MCAAVSNNKGLIRYKKKGFRINELYWQPLGIGDAPSPNVLGVLNQITSIDKKKKKGDPKDGGGEFCKILPRTLGGFPKKKERRGKKITSSTLIQPGTNGWKQSLRHGKETR